MDGENLEALTASLRRTLTDYVVGRRAILEDERKSEQGKGDAIRTLRDAAYAAAARTAGTIWGEVDPSTGQLKGGLAWKALDRAQERLREARDDADALDPVRVSAALERLPSRLRGAWRLEDVRRFYDLRADSYERRALQLHGERLLERFRTDNGYVSFLGDLARDLEDDLTTPEVQAALGTLERVDGLLLDAYAQVERAAALFGDAPFMGAGLGPFGNILASVDRLDLGRWTKRPSHIAVSEAVKRAWDAVLNPQQGREAGTAETDEERRARLFGG